MAKKTTAKKLQRYPVKIIIVGVPKVVTHVINALHGMDWAKGGDWLEVKRNKATGALTMTITIDFML